jgi:hypothetical protein
MSLSIEDKKIIQEVENGEISDELYNDIYDSLVCSGLIGVHNKDNCDDIINDKIKNIYDEIKGE